MNSNFTINSKNEKSSERIRLEKLQKDIESNTISADSISEEDFIKISALYDMQIREMNTQIKFYEEKVEKCTNDILNIRKKK